MENGSEDCKAVARVDHCQRTSCKWCRRVFPSRTQLFRHLRSDPACADATQRESVRASPTAVHLKGLPSRIVVLKVGYIVDGSCATRLTKELLTRCGAAPHGAELSRSSGDTSRLLTSDGFLGISLLKQEDSCGALEDIVTARFFSPFEGDALMSRLALEIQQHNDSSAGHDCWVLDARVLHKNDALHAEISCTQRQYNYLIPIWAITPDLKPPPYEQIQAAIGLNPSVSGTVVERPNFAQDIEDVKRPLQSFKQTIRRVLSSLEEVAAQDDALGTDAIDDRMQRFAGKRLYGSQSRRRCRWHNFADPVLSSSLNPQREAVRRALDKIKHAEAIVFRGDLWLAIGMLGDDFLTQQCRRLLATLICVHHGWLPADFIATATRKNVIVGTPVAPAHLLYLRACRFVTWSRERGELFDTEWVEKTTQAGSKFAPWKGLRSYGVNPEESAALGRQRLHAHIEAKEFSSCVSGGFKDWLTHVRDHEAPRIRAELAVLATLDDFAAGRWAAPVLPTSRTCDCPEPYRKVLELLSALVREGRWPATTPARLKVVRAGDGGTFSVGQNESHGLKPSKWTTRFPELTAAVFELERAIGPPGRPPSACVALNHNALFAPHTDVGAGLGQSTSLIVGLGPYMGGDLVIEGEATDIRYKPTEFDGWRQRHWTLPFAGERFTVVWFTPASRK